MSELQVTRSVSEGECFKTLMVRGSLEPSLTLRVTWPETANKDRPAGRRCRACAARSAQAPGKREVVVTNRMTTVRASHDPRSPAPLPDFRPALDSACHTG